jgi:Uma2 family endonuclease
MAVRTGPDRGPEPDAAVTLGPMKDRASLVLDDPLIVVEVVSPTSERTDAGAKLIEYFSVPTIRHYLIVLPKEKSIIHHRRNDDGTIQVRIVHGGMIRLDPPGIELSVDPILVGG